MALKVNKSNKEKTYKYVPIMQRDESDPFTVILKPLTPKEFALIEDKLIKMNKDESVTFTTGSFNWEVCKKGIVDWENMFDEKNQTIKIKRDFDGVTDESLNLLPLDMISEIANVITGITKDPDNANLYLGEG